MTVPDVARNTALLRATADADADQESDLFAVLFDELRSIATRMLRRERADHTLQPTALVHEAWLRLFDTRALSDGDRLRFFKLATVAMRHILIDHARRHRALRRGGAWSRVQLEGEVLGDPDPAGDLLVVDEVLQRLANVDARAAQVVELRVFGGLTTKEAADVLGLSERTARNDFVAGRAWLTREMQRGDGD